MSTANDGASRGCALHADDNELRRQATVLPLAASKRARAASSAARFWRAQSLKPFTGLRSERLSSDS